VTALDYDSQELIGKISFKHEIHWIDIRGTYLLVSFLSKIIVCDVYSLRHLFKISTGDERASYDVYFNQSVVDRDEFRFVHVDENRKQLMVDNCKWFSILKFCLDTI
jgi:hypothetical protein